MTLNERLRYEPETGDLFWIAGPRKGKPAGTFRNDGYRQISLNRKFYLAHRIAWFLMTGEWPRFQIDHIDNNRFNDQWSNLREATHSQNKMNTPMQSNNTTGFKGVQLDKSRSKFIATIKVDRKQHYLGQFDTAQEAYAVYVKAAKELHREYARLS